jgi:hypothetical protein
MSVTLLQKWQLLQSIFADQRLSLSAKIVARILLNHLNSGTRRCDPSVDTIAARCGLKRRSVSAALAELRDAGWIEQSRRRGISAFSFAFGSDDMQKPTPLPGEDEQLSAYQTADEVQQPASQGVQNPALQQVQETAPLRKTGNIETGKVKPGKKVSRPPLLSIAEIDREFAERFWPVYPRKPARLAGLKAYRNAIRRGHAAPAELLVGAERYVAERKGQDPKYTKHATTWLNAGCWAAVRRGAGDVRALRKKRTRFDA